MSEVGVMTCNMRSTSEAVIGDTYFKKDNPGTPLVVVEKPKPMVYAGFYPFNPSEQVERNIL
jgi:translation elongation factor EF-4